MKLTRPTLNQVFTISQAPEWPSIPFQTDAAGPHTWQWTLSWGDFKRSGTASTPGNAWDAATAVGDLGGSLNVTAAAGGQSASTTVLIRGTNPTMADVLTYLSTQPNGAGFDAIIKHETKGEHFRRQEPIRSFDAGYGMCQLTKPVPSYEEVWNWKRNIDAGLRLFQEKRKIATAYLGQAGRKFTDEQLKYEAVCRWNGGAYHVWDAAAQKWVRSPHVLCDSKTGNIGWDMNDPENKGKTEATLHQRDSASFSKPPGPGAHWRYFGVCYADRLLG